MKFEVEGFDEIVKAVKRVEGALYEDEATKAFLSVAKRVMSRARQKAPIGDHPTYSDRSTGYTKTPGRLRRAIIAAAFKRYAVQRYGPGAFAQVNLRRGKTTAPYANPLTSGRKSITTPKRARLLAWLSSSKGWQFARRVKGFPPNKFWDQAVASIGSSDMARVAEEIGKLIERRYAQ